MKKVTSVTTFNTDVGKRIAITYSEIDDDGNITKDNVKIQKVIVSADDLAKINAVDSIAQTIVNAIEE